MATPRPAAQVAGPMGLHSSLPNRHSVARLRRILRRPVAISRLFPQNLAGCSHPVGGILAEIQRAKLDCRTASRLPRARRDASSVPDRFQPARALHSTFAISVDSTRCCASANSRSSVGGKCQASFDEIIDRHRPHGAPVCCGNIRGSAGRALRRQGLGRRLRTAVRSHLPPSDCPSILGTEH